MSDYLSGAGAALMARLAEGGLFALLVGIALFPLLVVVIMFLLSLFSLLLFVFTWLVDRTMRRPCPSCGHAAREEALRCPKCQQGLEPNSWLVPPGRFSRWVAQQSSGAPNASRATTPSDAPGGQRRESAGPRAVHRPYLGVAASLVLTLTFGALIAVRAFA